MNQKNDFDKSNKVSIVGCGRVGMTTAYSMLLTGTPTDIVLFDRDKKKVLGEKTDLEDALFFSDYVNLIATNDFKDLEGSKLVIITAGVAQKPGETRLDLCKNNCEILESILPGIVKAAPEAVILMIANPVDILTYKANQIVPNAGGRIFGSGTMLDTSRFCYYLSEKLNVDPKSINAYILGEHGDNSFPVYKNATIGGTKLMDFPGVNEELIKEAYRLTKTAAARIIEGKGATYYGIATVATKIMEAIFSDAKLVMPLSVPLMDYKGYSGVALSVPCVLGAKGIERVLDIDFSEEEKNNFEKTVEVLKQYI